MPQLRGGVPEGKREGPDPRHVAKEARCAPAGTALRERCNPSPGIWNRGSRRNLCTPPTRLSRREASRSSPRRRAERRLTPDDASPSGPDAAPLTRQHESLRRDGRAARAQPVPVTARRGRSTMKTVLGCGMMLALTVGLAAARDDKGTLTDEEFVMKASAAGLAEVNAGRVAAKRASSAQAKEFAERVVKDHAKANKELLALADKKRYKVARTMDAKHRETFDKLIRLSGADFDREYVEGQVKEHEKAVALFEKQSTSGKDEKLKEWATKTLPTLKEHLRMAKDVKEKVGRGK